MTVVQFQPRPTPSQEWLAGEMALVRIPEHWGPELTAAARAALEVLLLAQINREAAQEAGRQGALQRSKAADKWRNQARADWAAYTGPLTKSAWAKRNASRYDRAWRAVVAAISETNGS